VFDREDASGITAWHAEDERMKDTEGAVEGVVAKDFMGCLRVRSVDQQGRRYDYCLDAIVSAALRSSGVDVQVGQRIRVRAEVVDTP